MLLEFTAPDSCLIGTLGEPGHRQFVFQASKGHTLVSVELDQQQSTVLARRVAEIVQELAELGRVELIDPEVVPKQQLQVPIEFAFRVGAIGLAWDPGKELLQIEMYSTELGAEHDEDADVLLQVWLTPAEAHIFSESTLRMIASGDPACPACGQQLDPAGHSCPRVNGYHAPEFS